MFSQYILGYADTYVGVCKHLSFIYVIITKSSFSYDLNFCTNWQKTEYHKENVDKKWP